MCLGSICHKITDIIVKRIVRIASKIEFITSEKEFNDRNIEL